MTEDSFKTKVIAYWLAGVALVKAHPVVAAVAIVLLVVLVVL